MNEQESEIIEKPSKSQLKRDFQARMDTIKSLVELSLGDIKKTVTDEFILKHIKEAKGLSASGAKNRLIKYIAKHIDDETLKKAQGFIDNRHGYEQVANAVFHGLEQKRDALIAQGDKAIQPLLDEHPNLDRQQLRQLVRQAVKEKDTGKPAGASRKLFRYLRDNLIED